MRTPQIHSDNRMTRRRRAHVGPVNRDFDETIKLPQRTVTLRRGLPYSDVTTDTSWRWSKLTVNNPWRPKKPRGYDPTARTLTAFSHAMPLLDYVDYDGIWTRYYTGPVRGLYATEYNRRYLNFSYLKTVDEQLRTEAILDAMEKVKDQKWNSGVALAESAGVAQMAVDLMQLVAATRKKIRQGDLVGAYREFRRKTKYMSYSAWKKKFGHMFKQVKSLKNKKRVPSGWLYYHFGILPTLNDISDAAHAHQTKLVDLLYGKTLTVQGYAKHTTKLSDSVASAVDNVVTFKALRSVRVSIPVRPKGEMIARLSGLGVTNPPEAAWNAVPFSWVVDYFSTFGRWLGALDTSLAWNFGEFWTESWRLTAESHIEHRSSNRYKFGSTSVPHYLRYKELRRVVRGDLYGPMGSVLPTFKRRGPSLGQFSNMLSVLATSMKSTVRP